MIGDDGYETARADAEIERAEAVERIETAAEKAARDLTEMLVEAGLIPEGTRVEWDNTPMTDR